MTDEEYYTLYPIASGLPTMRRVDNGQLVHAQTRTTNDWQLVPHEKALEVSNVQNQLYFAKPNSPQFFALNARKSALTKEMDEELRNLYQPK
jgi:hypothetical protein